MRTYHFTQVNTVSKRVQVYSTDESMIAQLLNDLKQDSSAIKVIEEYSTPAALGAFRYGVLFSQRNTDHVALQTWCIKYLGERGWEPFSIWGGVGGTVSLRRAVDA